jgi:hypothetical protein
MKSFKDTEGREWIVKINVAAIKRVKGLLGIDLYLLVDDGFKGLSKLIADPIQLVDVVYVLCKGKADERNVTDEQFGEAMAGDAIEHAAKAFVLELTDFFPDPRARAGLKKVMDKSDEIKNLLMAHAELLLDAVDVQSEAEKLLISSGVAPASSESTPDPSRSPSSS